MRFAPESRLRRQKEEKWQRVPKHRATVTAMGLTKMHKTVELPDNASTRGMIAQVGYMLKVEEA